MSHQIRNFLCAALIAPSIAFGAILETTQGKLLGMASNVDPSIQVFKSIPFAKPPVGARRWQHSEPAPGWQSLRSATEFSPTCSQTPYPEGSIFSSANRPSSEDCLYLNVWRHKSAEKQPVMVWIHGGSFTRGTGATRAYDGTKLATKGVVVVTINYRLGVFGYLNHPELEGANFGTTDQIQALQWVKNNIADYGGDPDNVTVFGESAGSISVSQLMASPLAKGLFHRTIGQSGAALYPMPDLSNEDNGGYKTGLALQQKLAAADLQELRNRDARQLLKAAQGLRFQVAVDGKVFPAQIRDVYAEGKIHPVPLLAGFNAHEGTTLGVTSRIPATAEAYEAGVRTRMGPIAEEYLSHYPASDLRSSTLDVFRDRFVTWPMQTWAMAVEELDQPAYLYYFTYEPMGNKLGAFHAAEIMYAFDTVALLETDARPVTDADSKLADIMSSYWVNFAKRGNPNGKGLPKWREYTAKKRRYMEFDEVATPRNDLLPGVWEFHEKLNSAR